MYIIFYNFFLIIIFDFCCNKKSTLEDGIEDLFKINKNKIPIKKVGKTEENDGNKDNNQIISIKENEYYSASYSLGYLTIGTEFMKFSIKIMGFGSYLASILK